jgi:hypothetical protein
MPATPPAVPPAAPPAAPPAPEPPDLASPAGTLTVEGTTAFENTVLAYERMLRVTEFIADAVARLAAPGRAAADCTYVVVTAEDLEALALARQVAAALDAARGALDAVAPAPSLFKSDAEDALAGVATAAAALGAAGAAVSPAVALAGALASLTGLAKHAIGLAGLFRRDVTLTEVPVVIGDAAVQLAVAGELASQGFTVRCPTVYAPVAAGGGRRRRVRGARQCQQARADAEQRAAAAADEPGPRPRPPAARRGAADARRRRAPGARRRRRRRRRCQGGGSGRGGGGARVGDHRGARRRCAARARARAGERRRARVSRGLVGSADVQLSGGLVTNVAVFATDGRLVGAGTWPNHSDFVEFGTRTGRSRGRPGARAGA